MDKKRIKFLGLVVAAAVLLSFGCGSGEYIPPPVEEGSGLVNVHFEGSAGGTIIEASQNDFLKDATDTTTGAGDDADGVDSIYDETGAAYIFEKDQGSPNNWGEQASLFGDLEI